MTNSNPRIIIASGILQWLFDRIPLAAITLPFGRHGIILLDDSFKYHQPLLRHELVHIEQIKREGRLRFAVKYLWYLAKYGYRENPYEREAYAKEPL